VTTVFADTSAIVKRYADEVDHQVVRALGEPLVVSALARIEVHSALWRKRRLGELTDDAVAVLSDEFESDWWGDDHHEASFIAVAITDSVLDVAVSQVARHGLRASDAVQLASAIEARQAEPSIESFACFDAELRGAAVREGFALVPAASRLTPRRRS
jgi:predicted nucleic acid-binding protein